MEVTFLPPNQSKKDIMANYNQYESKCWNCECVLGEDVSIECVINPDGEEETMCSDCWFSGESEFREEGWSTQDSESEKVVFTEEETVKTLKAMNASAFKSLEENLTYVRRATLKEELIELEEWAGNRDLSKEFIDLAKGYWMMKRYQEDSSDSDSEDEEDEERHICHSCNEELSDDDFQKGKMCCDKPMFHDDHEEESSDSDSEDE